MHDTTDFEFYVGSDFKHIIPYNIIPSIFHII